MIIRKLAEPLAKAMSAGHVTIDKVEQKQRKNASAPSIRLDTSVDGKYVHTAFPTMERHPDSTYPTVTIKIYINGPEQSNPSFDFDNARLIDINVKSVGRSYSTQYFIARSIKVAHLDDNGDVIDVNELKGTVD